MMAVLRKIMGFQGEKRIMIEWDAKIPERPGVACVSAASIEPNRARVFRWRVNIGSGSEEEEKEAVSSRQDDPGQRMRRRGRHKSLAAVPRCEVKSRHLLGDGS